MRSTTFPNIYDDILKLRISTIRDFLNKYGKNGYDYASTGIEWTRNGEKRSSIRIGFYPHKSELAFNYEWNGQHVEYTVTLKRIESNMKPGTFYYLFQCPVTHKLCRVLYLHNGVFSSRHTIPHAFYQTQLNNKYSGDWALLEYAWDLEEIYFDAAYPGKHFKRFYRNAVTKPWRLKLNKLVRAVDAGERKCRRMLYDMCDRYPAIMDLYDAVKNP